jgi:hypothetical protein
MTKPLHWSFIVGRIESPLVRKFLPLHSGTISAPSRRVAFPQGCSCSVLLSARIVVTR